MKELTKKQKEQLHELYFDKHFTFGRDKIYKYLQANKPELNISRRQVMKWLASQELQQLFRNIKPTKDIKSTIASAPYKQIAMDLKDMQNDAFDNYNYILAMKDLFSKKVWVEAIIDKEGPTVFKAIKNLLSSMKKMPESLRSDNGSEFLYLPLQKYLKKNKITHIFSSAGNPQSNGGIERFNADLKRLINMYRTQTGDKNWVAKLPALIDNYNNSVSRVTGKTPNQLDEIDLPDKEQVLDKIKKSVKKLNTKQEQVLLPLNTQVRLKVLRDKLQKSDGINWTQDIFRIYKRFKSKNGNSEYYYVKKGDDKYTEKIYPQDIQEVTAIDNKVKEQDEKYEISKIVKPVMSKNGKIFVESYEVQWKGFRAKDNTIEPRSALIVDVPKLIKQYEKKNKVEWKPRSVTYKK